MAAAIGRTQCVRCGKKRCTSTCAGCSKDFCHNHFNEHYEELTQQLDEIETSHKKFQESVAEQMKKLEDNPLIQQIDTWEQDSIKKIKDAAEKAKQSLIQHINEHYKEIKTKLNILTNQLREVREENDFNEIVLRQFQDELTQLKTKPIDLPIIPIRKESWSCISDTHTKLPGLIWLSSIKIQSDVYIKHIEKMAAVENRLGTTTHRDIDDSSRHRLQQMSENLTEAINRVVTDVQDQQSALLTDAHDQTTAIEKEYITRLQRHVEELDQVRAQNLTTIQKNLHLHHAMIFEEARKRIDDLYEKANSEKMIILQEVQAPMNARVENMSEQQTTASNAENSNRV